MLVDCQSESRQSIQALPSLGGRDQLATLRGEESVGNLKEPKGRNDSDRARLDKLEQVL